MKKIIIVLSVLLVIVFVIISKDNPYEQIKVRFECDNNEWIDATYYNHREKDSYAKLSLSNNQDITVYQAISASGARYLSQDESVEFWTKGDSVVSIKENNETIFENCVVANQDTIISWDRLVSAINDCEVESVFQAHSGRVTAILKSGETLVATESNIDDIFSIVSTAELSCGEIEKMIE